MPPSSWDYVYITNSFTIYGRDSEDHYHDNSEFGGMFLGHSYCLEDALTMAYYFVQQYNIETAPRISEYVHVPLELVS